MKIAQISPLIESVPPRLYGGTERIVSYLTEELVRQGHDVVLFASGDSETSAELVPCCPEALRLAGVRDTMPYNVLQLERLRRRIGDFDVVHFHTDYLHFPIIRSTTCCAVTTMHGRLDLPDYPPLFSEYDDMPLVSISDHQRRPLCARWLATVHHGLPAELYAYSEEGSNGYLAFLGRICPEKRADRAIEIALRTGLELKLAAKVDRVDRDYFNDVIRPLLANPRVEFIGEISEREKQAFLGKARALLFPIDWPEPFGLVMIEAMACGTPVIAWPQGSVPEVVDEGITGFVVDTIGDAVAAVERLDSVDRRRVRHAFERRFTAERMARDYLKVYETLAESRPILLKQADRKIDDRPDDGAGAMLTARLGAEDKSAAASRQFGRGRL
jgi:glycosyltransferase involved in cell wall biosynthesis